jgi:hypothetical protein
VAGDVIFLSCVTGRQICSNFYIVLCFVEFDFRTRRIAAVCMIVTCSLLNVAARDALTFLCIGYVAFFNFVVLLCSAALIISYLHHHSVPSMQKIGLFFLFLGHYTTWLLPAAIVGFFAWINVASDDNKPVSAYSTTCGGPAVLCCACEAWLRVCNPSTGGCLFHLEQPRRVFGGVNGICVLCGGTVVVCLHLKHRQLFLHNCIPSTACDGA